jgi:hypothetical protein
MHYIPRQYCAALPYCGCRQRILLVGPWPIKLQVSCSRDFILDCREDRRFKSSTSLPASCIWMNVGLWLFCPSILMSYMYARSLLASFPKNYIIFNCMLPACLLNLPKCWTSYIPPTCRHECMLPSCLIISLNVYSLPALEPQLMHSACLPYNLSECMQPSCVKTCPNICSLPPL